MHIASIETAGDENPLSNSSAFQAFVAGIRDRCEEQPTTVELAEIGSYQFFGN